MAREAWKLSEQAQRELKEIFGDWVKFDERERKLYSHDIGVLPSLIKPLVGNALAAAVVKAQNQDDLIQVVKWAQRHGVNLVPRAAATSGYGGVVPVKGGVVVDVTSLNRLLEVDKENLLVRVEPGIVWEKLEADLNKVGLSVRMMPSSSPSSTVGGWLAQNGAGFGSYQFGWFKDNVVSVKVVLPNGEVKVFEGTEIAKVAGAMGTTGFIVEVTLPLRRHDEERVIAATFESAASLTQALRGLGEGKIPLWSVSFINPTAARLKNQVPPREHHGVPEEKGPPLPEKYLALFVYPASLETQVDPALKETVKKAQGEVLSQEVAEHEWEERFNPMKLKRLGPSIIPAEVVVPLSQLDEVLKNLERLIKQPLSLEGMVVKGDEVVLLGLIPHDERQFKFNFAYGLALSVLKIAKKYGGRAYASGLYLAREAPQVFKEDLKKLLDFKAQVDQKSLMNPNKLEGKSSLNRFMGLAYFFEPVVRSFGNLSKVPLNERFQEKKGIPGDVAWYAYACAQCGYCVNTCDQYYGRGWESQSPRGKWFWLKEYLEGKEELDQAQVNTFLVCTTCEFCNVRCQIDLPVEPSWMKLRDVLVREKGFMTFPPFYMMAASARKEKNIWANYADNRDKWLPEEVKPKLKEKAEIAYFAGCTASFVEQDIAKAAVTLLDKAGVEFAYLGTNEACCGIPMLVAGKWDVFEEIMRHNVGAMKEKEVKTVVTSCPACWLVWHTIYPQWAEKLGLDYPFETKHYSEILAEKIKSGELRFDNPVNMRVTFHDSCHIGRAGGIYEPPRELIKALPGVEFVEMEHNRENGLCCGSVLTLVGEPEVAPVIGDERLREAEEVGAEALLALCPCCQFQLRVTADKVGKNLPVKDLAAFVAKGLGYDFPDSTSDCLSIWAVFYRMIDLMKAENLASLMEELLPQMMKAMPSPLRAMMKVMKYVPGGLAMMKPMMPKMMPLLMPVIMPKVFPDMVEAVGRRVRPMPQVMEEQMPALLEKTMEEFMPKILPQVAKLVTPSMIDYLKTY